MSLRAACIVSTLLLAPAAEADACGTPDHRGLDGLRLQRPAPGDVIAGFGIRKHPLLLIDKFHSGLDLAAAAGEPVHAAASGRVVFAERRGEYGNLVEVDHGGGVVTAYGHLSRITVKAGDCVAPGDVIGLAGATGLTAGPILHFEVRVAGQQIDPESVIASR